MLRRPTLNSATVRSFAVLATLTFALAACPSSARAQDAVTPAGDVAAEVLAAQAKRVAVMRQSAAATVAVFGPDGGGGGSGVLITPDGYALTNYHVSSACGDHMRCGLNDGKVYDAVIVGIDATGDVSLIKLYGRDDFPTAPLADSDQVRVGQWCFSAGNPFVLATNLQPSISLGIVSGVHRYQYPAGTLLEYADCLQTDAAVNPGNSGGPLFNLAGEVIGINGRCSFEKRGRVNVGVGYAISANQLKSFLGMLESGRLVDHATLGATVSTDDSDRVTISNILNGSDAFRRGLRYGDEIVALADREVRTTNMFKNILGTLPKDWRVPLTIRRDGAEQTLLVRLAGVHTEKELLQLVSAELGAPPVPEGKPRDSKQEESNEDKASQPDQSDDDDADFVLDEVLITKPGFANYYFNQTRQNALWEATQGLWYTQVEPQAWTLKGSLAGESTAVSIRLDANVAELKLGSRPITLDFQDASMSDVVAKRREDGLLVALRAMQEYLRLGPSQLGDTVYLGKLPVYMGTNRTLAEQPLHEVLQTSWYDATVRISFYPNSREISLIEIFGDQGEDPVEVYFDDYRDVQVAGDRSVRFPGRMRLQYGVEPLALLTFDEIQLSDLTNASPAAAAVAPLGPEVQP